MEQLCRITVFAMVTFWTIARHHWATVENKIKPALFTVSSFHSFITHFQCVSKCLMFLICICGRYNETQSTLWRLFPRMRGNTKENEQPWKKSFHRQQVQRSQGCLTCFSAYVWLSCNVSPHYCKCPLTTPAINSYLSHCMDNCSHIFPFQNAHVEYWSPEVWSII